MTEQPYANDQDILEEHLPYEMDSMIAAYNVLAAKPVLAMVLSEWATQALVNVEIEAFSTHARNLIDFYNNAGKRDDDVWASEFTESGEYQAEFVARGDIQDLIDKINKQIAHLTRRRTRDQRLKVGSKDRARLLELLQQEAIKFRGELKQDYLQWLPERFGAPLQIVQTSGSAEGTTSKGSSET